MVETKKAQDWLKEEYENNKTEKVKAIVFNEIKIGDDNEAKKVEKLEGEMVIDGKGVPILADIEKVDLFKAGGITKLTIKDCPKITEISVYGNPELTEIVGLEIENLPDLVKLNCGNTQIKEINISKNAKLRELYFTKNTQTKIVGFSNVVKNLVLWSSINGIPFPWEQIPEGYLKEIAGELGIKEAEIKDKPVDEVKEIIKEKAKKVRGNEEKIKDKLPGLINNETGEVVGDKLDELKNLSENKGDVAEKIKKLELKNEILEKAIEKIEGEDRLKEYLAQIEVSTNKS